MSLRLAPEGEVPDGMVLVPGADSLGGVIGIAAVEGPHDPYFIDRYEVTNRQFKQFADQGGYQKREYWKTPFVRDGKLVSWDEAMAVFRDTPASVRDWAAWFTFSQVAWVSLPLF